MNLLRRIGRAIGRFNDRFGSTAVASSGLSGGRTANAAGVNAVLGELEKRPDEEPERE